MKIVVWVDELFLNNLLITLLILWATARLSHLLFSWWRLILSSIFGSFYTVMTLYPSFGNLPLSLQLLSHLLLSALLIRIAFDGTYMKLLQTLGYLYLITFIMGGSILASYHLLGGSPLKPFLQVVRLYRGDLWVLLLGIVFLGLLGRYGLGVIHQYLFRGAFHLPICIHLGDEKVGMMGLVDTGNRLRDPLNQDPVIIVEWKAFHVIIPFHIPNSPTYDLMDILSVLEESQLASRLRIIPYGAIEGEGMLLGLRPDGVMVQHKGQEYWIKNVVLGLIFQPLDPKGEYNALLHPEIYQSLMGDSLHIDE